MKTVKEMDEDSKEMDEDSKRNGWRQ